MSLEQGKWTKGQKKYLATDGCVYDVNTENGIYKDREGVTRKAGSWVPNSERHIEVVVDGEFMKTIQQDENGRKYKSEIIRTKEKK